MPVSEARKKARNKYDSKNYEYCTVKLYKGHKTNIDEAAKAEGLSRNKFIIKAIDERIEALRGHPKPQYQTPEAKEAIKKLRLKGDEKG